MKTHLNAIKDNAHKEDKCLAHDKENKNIRMIEMTKIVHHLKLEFNKWKY